MGKVLNIWSVFLSQLLSRIKSSDILTEKLSRLRSAIHFLFFFPPLFFLSLSGHGGE